MRTYGSVGAPGGNTRGHPALEHFRSPAADSSLCHFDDKLPGPARSRPVLKCASDRLTECISDWFRARTGGAHRRQLRPGSKLLR